MLLQQKTLHLVTSQKTVLIVEMKLKMKLMMSLFRLVVALLVSEEHEEIVILLTLMQST